MAIPKSLNQMNQMEQEGEIEKINYRDNGLLLEIDYTQE